LLESNLCAAPNAPTGRQSDWRCESLRILHSARIFPSTCSSGPQVVAHKTLAARRRVSTIGKIIEKSRISSSLVAFDEFYIACLSVRSQPISQFLGGRHPEWALPISSINEDKLLSVLGLGRAERNLMCVPKLSGSHTVKCSVHGPDQLSSPHARVQ
jgi:hypothetical protein